MSKYELNQVVTGVVTGIEDYGIFIKVDEYYTGMIHISEISDRFISNIRDCYIIGDSIKALVIGVNDEAHHLKLSVKSLNSECIDKSLNGFEPLKNELDGWIENKYNEIENNKDTNN